MNVAFVCGAGVWGAGKWRTAAKYVMRTPKTKADSDSDAGGKLHKVSKPKSSASSATSSKSSLYRRGDGWETEAENLKMAHVDHRFFPYVKPVDDQGEDGGPEMPQRR